jgi:GNAT superfamily N-acetyltransferase
MAPPDQSFEREINIKIRELDPSVENEIKLVAGRMRDTLIELEGQEVGSALYSMEWLEERVRWHLNPQMGTAKVFLAIEEHGQIVGHTIVRQETNEHGQPYGLFSTTYVLPAARRSGIAQQLLSRGENWMRDLALGSAVTWTSGSNIKLIKLYKRNGYAQTAQHVHKVTATIMVKLKKNYADTAASAAD